MNFDNLNTFISLLEHRNYNVVAEKLNVSQSTVSARIMTLEDAIGSKLFERSRSGVFPTFSGTRFEPHARLLLDSWNHAKNDLISNTHFDDILRLSCEYGLLSSRLVDFILILQEKLPRTRLDLQTRSVNTVSEKVATGMVDIGLVYTPQYLPNVTISEVGIERFVMVSTITDKLREVDSKRYFFARYTKQLEQFQQEELSHLTDYLCSIDEGVVAIDLLQNIGGSVYLSKGVAEKLIEKNSSCKIVQDAPVIQQPIFSAVNSQMRKSSGLDCTLNTFVEFANSC